jgi:hypothetical protein
MNRLLAVLAGAAAALALAPAAQAAEPINLGNGSFPDVAVDSNGTTHIVWDVHDPPPAGDYIQYCQIPKGGTACATGPQTQLSSVAEAVGRSTYVFAPTPDRIIIVSHRCCSPDATFAYVSTNRGINFADGVQIGNLDADDGVLGSDDAFYGVDTGGRVQRMPIAGPGVTAQAMLNPGFPVPTGSSIAFLPPGNRPIKASADGDNTTVSSYKGAGEVNDAANWDGPTPITPAGSEPHLASSAGSTVMIHRVGGAGGELHAVHLNGTAPVATLSTADPIQADLAANANDRFTAAWVENGVTPNEVRIATSTDGSNWGKAQPILRANSVDDLFHTQLAIGPDGKGFAVFDNNNRTGNITAIPLEPLSDNEPVQTATVGDQELSFFAPQACVQPPEKVTLRVTSKRKKKLSPNRRVKIRSVVFSVDKTKKTDKKAAFKQAFSTANFARGTFHQVRAVVTLQPVKKGAFKDKKKTLKGRFNVCG